MIIIENIIREEIKSLYSSNSLEDAQRFYGSLVPWVLDERDLQIINSIREKFFVTLRTISNPKDENKISNLWDAHFIDVKEKLWNNAQK